MREAFAQLARGSVALPLRSMVPVPDRDGALLVMPARCDLPLGLGGKMVTVFPGNPPLGRPLIHATVILMSAESGELRAVLEGTALTAIRTGAASGLASALLARGDAAAVAVIGAGVQARTQLEAVCCVREIERVRVYAPTRVHAERFAAEMATVPGVPAAISVAGSAADAIRGADIVCAATTSATPVVRLGDVGPGVHVNAVGSYTRAMRELDPALLGRARVVVDQREAVLAEAGEVIAAVEAGLVAEQNLVELGAVVTGAEAGRTRDDELTVFKSVGLAVQDVVAGAWAVEEAERRGLGTRIAQ